MIVTVLTFTVSELFFEKGSKCHPHYSVPHLAQCSLSNCSTYTAITQAHCWSRVHDTSAVDILGDSNNEASQIAIFSVDSNQ